VSGVLLEPHRGQALEALGPRIDLDAGGLQGRHAEDGLGVIFAEDDRGADDLAQELEFPGVMSRFTCDPSASS